MKLCDLLLTWFDKKRNILYGPYFDINLELLKKCSKIWYYKSEITSGPFFGPLIAALFSLKLEVNCDTHEDLDLTSQVKNQTI